MKLKKILLLVITLIVIFVFSGCANITCTLNLKEDGTIDAEASVLYSDKEFSYNNESIEKAKKELLSKGFNISDINENGMIGFSVSKEDVNLNSLNDILLTEYGVDLKDNDIIELDYEKGFLYNNYDLDTDVDLTAFSKINSLTDGNGNVITGEELQKVFSHISLKLITKLEKGTILSTNSKHLSQDKKTAEWVLIPGTKSEIEMEAITAGIMPIVGTIVILSVVLGLTILILIIMTRMYLKRRKECNED